ncbi:MAG: WD40 repeat domain-containing protein, partial [Verrucomicrobiales bacterium]
MAIEADFEELKKRAGDPDPRVRALALMKLFASGNPQAFRVIHGRLKDEGKAFPQKRETVSVIPVTELKKLLSREEIAQFNARTFIEQKTVGEWAEIMLDMIGFYPNQDFEEWAKPRLDNPDWLGWYEFLLLRVTEGTRPVPRGIEDKLAEFEKVLATRPPELRAWLGFLAADEAMMVSEEDTVLGTREELIEAGKALGPDASLLAFLRDGTRAGLTHPKVDAPHKGRRFVLRHAKSLFRPEDAGALYDMECYIAAADVRPEKASFWLREACEKWGGSHQSGDRARAMAALLDLRGEEEAEYVAAWFHENEPEMSGSSVQSSFVDEYRRRKPEGWREVLRALVAHPGFERIQPGDLVSFGYMVNELHGGNVIGVELRHREREADLRNTIRRVFGVEEKKIQWLDVTDRGEAQPSGWSLPLEGEARTLVVSAEGDLAALVMADGAIRLHQTSDGTFLGQLEASESSLAAVEFCRSDGRLMLVRERGEVEFWRTRPLELERAFKVEGFRTRTACFDPNGTWLASAQTEGGVLVYDLPTGKLRWRIPMRIRAFELMGASPDGSRFALCTGFSRSVLLFDPASAEALARLDGHAGVPNSLAFSSDGESLVTRGDDTKIMVWDAKTGGRVAEYASRQLHAPVYAFTADS